MVRFVIGIGSFFLSLGLIRSITGHWSKQSLVSQRQQVLKQEEERSRELIMRLQEATGAAFIEKQARDKLGLVKEGETIVLLDKLSINGDDSAANEVALSPTWKNWWKLFF